RVWRGLDAVHRRAQAANLAGRATGPGQRAQPARDRQQGPVALGPARGLPDQFGRHDSRGELRQVHRRPLAGRRVARARATGTDKQMKLPTSAATGGIGRHLVGQAIAAGHDVTAVARNPAALPAEVRAVKADLATAQPANLTTAVGGADAVLSALGPRSKADYGITSTGTRAITGAMQAAGVRRVVVVSAAPVGTFASPRRPQPPKH